MMNYALITGATSGIGYELAKIFAREGNDLILVANQKDKLMEIAEELPEYGPARIKVIPQDLSLPDAAEKIFNKVKEWSVFVDKLVNNAGFYIKGPFYQTDWEREQKLIQLECINHTSLVKLFLPEMIKRNNGKILNVCSTASFIPGPYNAIYCASKSFMLSFTEALAGELSGSGVSVTALCPGGTNTSFQDLSKRKSGFINPLMEPSVVAKEGYTALMKGRRLVVPGVTNKLQVFAMRFLPRGVVAKIAGSYVNRQSK